MLINPVPFSPQKIIANRFQSDLILGQKYRVTPVIIKGCHEIFYRTFSLTCTSSKQAIHHVKQSILSKVLASHKIDQNTILMITCITSAREGIVEMHCCSSCLGTKMIFCSQRNSGS